MKEIHEPVPIRLEERFDCVLMLTLSNWDAELRGNRYHWATRLARLLPVVFVQPDDLAGARWQPTGPMRLDVLHVVWEAGPEQSRTVLEALSSRGFRRPLVWVYNWTFLDLLRRLDAFVVFHATEDWMNPDPRFFGLPEEQRRLYGEAVERADLLLATSEGILERLRSSISPRAATRVVTNGCDFAAWAISDAEIEALAAVPAPGNVALYQGGIFWKLDFDLLGELARRMHDWEFWFCGVVYGDGAAWRELRELDNVKDLGRLTPSGVRDRAMRASAGLIPYLRDPIATRMASPLKAWEYVAAGLPVVCSPIDTLAGAPDLFLVAEDAAGFEIRLRASAPTRHQPGPLRRRRAAARLHDYDRKFDEVVSHIESLAAKRV